MGKLRLELIILTTNLIKTRAQHAAAVKAAELNSLNGYFRSLPSSLHHGTVRRAELLHHLLADHIEGLPEANVVVVDHAQVAK